MTLRILVVDDEKNIRDGLARALRMEGYEPLPAEDGNQAINMLSVDEPDLLITDLKMPRMDGHRLLKTVVSNYPGLPVIVLTGHGTVETAVEAMREGAYDFLTKPVNLDHLFLLIRRALGEKRLRQDHDALTKELDDRRMGDLAKFGGRSEAIRALFDSVKRAAPTRASVLILGESGAGKELVADALHALSPRHDKPLVKVHCAALNESLLESELFGHEKGAFTGALGRHKGRFELADGGDIFLDEIGEIPPHVQVKLLRVLQEKSFERVGGEDRVDVNVRIIAATNRNLPQEVKDGKFREDLFYRLNVVTLTAPPLRERREDILPLALAFLKEFSAENGRNIVDFTSEAQTALINYRWPGNVRELRNRVESAVIMCEGPKINAEDLRLASPVSSRKSLFQAPMGLTLEDVERLYAEATVLESGGNKSRAAQTLSITRKTLLNKLREPTDDQIDLKGASHV